MTHKIRFLKPVQSPAYTCKGSVAEAACELLGRNLDKALFIRPNDAGRTDGDTTYFSVMAAEDGQEFTARYFFGGIGRAGTVRPAVRPMQCTTMAEIEVRLGLAPDALNCDWDGEETEVQARDRKFDQHPA